MRATFPALVLCLLLTGCSGVVVHRGYVLVPTSAAARTQAGREHTLGLIHSYLAAQGYRAEHIDIRNPSGFHSALRYAKRAAGAFDTYPLAESSIGLDSYYSYVPPLPGPSAEFRRVEQGVMSLDFRSAGFSLRDDRPPHDLSTRAR
jgi:hypothetical protein